MLVVGGSLLGLFYIQVLYSRCVMNIIENHLSLCSKSFEQLAPNLYAVINNNDELNICYGNDCLNIPLLCIATADDTFAIIIEDSNEMGVYVNGKLVIEQEVSAVEDDYIVNCLLDCLLAEISEDNLPQNIPIKICTCESGRIKYSHAFSLTKSQLNSSSKQFVLYSDNAINCFPGRFSTFYLLVDGKVLPISSSIPSFVIEMGYVYYFSINPITSKTNIVVTNLKTGKRFTFESWVSNHLECYGAYLPFCDSDDRYLLDFTYYDYISLNSKRGVVLSLPHDDSDVQFYEGLLSYESKLIYQYNPHNIDTFTVSNLDNEIIAKDSVFDWFSLRYIICYEMIFDTVRGEIHNVRVDGVSSMLLHSTKGNVYIYHVITDGDGFYGMKVGELVNSDISLLYHYSKKYRDKTSDSPELMISKFKSNGLYAITDKTGTPTCPILFDCEEQAVKYIKSHLPNTFRRMTFQ